MSKQKKIKSEVALNKKNIISKNKTVLLKKVNKVNINKKVYKKSTDFADLVNLIIRESSNKSFPNINKNVK